MEISIVRVHDYMQPKYRKRCKHCSERYDIYSRESRKVPSDTSKIQQTPPKKIVQEKTDPSRLRSSSETDEKGKDKVIRVDLTREKSFQRRILRPAPIKKVHFADNPYDWVTVK